MTRRGAGSGRLQKRRRPTNVPGDWPEELRSPNPDPDRPPNLTTDEAKARMRLARSRWRNVSWEDVGGPDDQNHPEDGGYLTAAYMTEFCEHVAQGTPVPNEIMRDIASGFRCVLLGMCWETAFELPGRPEPEPHSVLQPLDLRDFQLCGMTLRIMDENGLGVGAAMRSAAAQSNVSYETARAAYYRWIKILGCNSSNAMPEE